MGFSYRKSKSLGGGLRLNITGRGVGVSAGRRGARLSVNSRGQKGVSLGLLGLFFRKRWR
jgi:hypothetical protein